MSNRLLKPSPLSCHSTASTSFQKIDKSPKTLIHPFISNLFKDSVGTSIPRPTPLLLCLFHLCPTNFEVTWPPSTSASSGCQSDNGCLAAIRLTGLVGACNR